MGLICLHSQSSTADSEARLIMNGTVWHDIRNNNCHNEQKYAMLAVKSTFLLELKPMSFEI